MRMIVVTLPMVNTNLSRVLTRLWSTLDNPSLRKQSKASSKNMKIRKRRTPSKYVSRMLSKKPRRRRNVKKKRRRRRKSNRSVMKSRGKRTIEKKDC